MNIFLYFLLPNRGKGSELHLGRVPAYPHALHPDPAHDIHWTDRNFGRLAICGHQVSESIGQHCMLSRSWDTLSSHPFWVSAPNHLHANPKPAIRTDIRLIWLTLQCGNVASLLFLPRLLFIAKCYHLYSTDIPTGAVPTSCSHIPGRRSFCPSSCRRSCAYPRTSCSRCAKRTSWTALIRRPCTMFTLIRIRFYTGELGW